MSLRSQPEFPDLGPPPLGLFVAAHRPVAFSSRLASWLAIAATAVVLAVESGVASAAPPHRRCDRREVALRYVSGGRHSVRGRPRCAPRGDADAVLDRRTNARRRAAARIAATAAARCSAGRGQSCPPAARGRLRQRCPGGPGARPPISGTRGGTPLRGNLPSRDSSSSIATPHGRTRRGATSRCRPPRSSGSPRSPGSRSRTSARCRAARTSFASSSRSASTGKVARALPRAAMPRSNTSSRIS